MPIFLKALENNAEDENEQDEEIGALDGESDGPRQFVLYVCHAAKSTIHVHVVPSTNYKWNRITIKTYMTKEQGRILRSFLVWHCCSRLFENEQIHMYLYMYTHRMFE